MKCLILNITLLLLIQFCLTGCTGQMFVLKPEGDRAKISANNKINIEAKLLAVNDSLLYVNIISGRKSLGVSQSETLIGLDLNGIENIRIRGYTNRNWILPWLALQVLPPIFFAIVASNADSGDEIAILGVTSIPAIVSGVTMSMGTPKDPTITNEFTAQKISELNKYTRYPLGLNEGQLMKIAESYGQQGYRIFLR